MTYYSIQPRDQIFVKGYECLSFAKNMSISTNVKSISTNVSGKYSPGMLACVAKVSDHETP